MTIKCADYCPFSPLKAEEYSLSTSTEAAVRKISRGKDIDMPHLLRDDSVERNTRSFWNLRILQADRQKGNRNFNYTATGN